MKAILLPLGIGLFAGVMAGLCGVGGGIVMVPCFTFLLGMEQKAAIATSMAVILPTAIMSVSRFAHFGMIQWNIFLPTAIGAITAAFFATEWAKKMSNEHLTKVFAVLMILVGVSMFFKKG